MLCNKHVALIITSSNETISICRKWNASAMFVCSHSNILRWHQSKMTTFPAARGDVSVTIGEIYASEVTSCQEFSELYKWSYGFMYQRRPGAHFLISRWRGKSQSHELTVRAAGSEGTWEEYLSLQPLEIQIIAHHFILAPVLSLKEGGSQETGLLRGHYALLFSCRQFPS